MTQRRDLKLCLEEIFKKSKNNNLKCVECVGVISETIINLTMMTT